VTTYDAILRTVAAHVPGPRSGARAVVVAVDGVDGVGKSTFADGLAAVLRAGGRSAVTVRADDFLNPRSVRYARGRDSAEGFWRDSYDHAVLRRDVVDAARGRGSYRPAAHDLAADCPVAVPDVALPDGAVVVIDGCFLLDDHWTGAWDLSVLLTAPFAVSVARMAARDGGPSHPDDPAVRRYVEGQRLYQAHARPHERADLVVDLTDLSAPLLVGDRFS